MGGGRKRFVCAYCAKSLADQPSVRRRHVDSVTHRRNVQAHYAAVTGTPASPPPPSRLRLSTGVP